MCRSVTEEQFGHFCLLFTWTRTSWRRPIGIYALRSDTPALIVLMIVYLCELTMPAFPTLSYPSYTPTPHAPPTVNNYAAPFIAATTISTTQESPCDHIIKSDIHRTFPAHNFFKEAGGSGQESLFRICKVRYTNTYIYRLLSRSLHQHIHIYTIVKVTSPTHTYID